MNYAFNKDQHLPSSHSLSHSYLTGSSATLEPFNGQGLCYKHTDIAVVDCETCFRQSLTQARSNQEKKSLGNKARLEPGGIYIYPNQTLSNNGRSFAPIFK